MIETSPGAAARPSYRLPPIAALAWLGRQGARAVAALVVLGIAVPPLGALLRPFVPEAIFLLLVVSFARVDVAALHRHIRRPALVLAAAAWTGIAVPLAFGAVALAAGLDRAEPGLFLGLMLQGMTSPMMAAPALAAMAGLDATLVLVTLVAGTALVPLVAPLVAALFLGGMLGLAPVALALKLAGMLGGSCLLALLVRRVVGPAAIERHAEAIGGGNILLLLVFVAAVMGDLVPQVLAEPLRALGFAGIAAGSFLGLLGLTALLFRRAGRVEALSLGLVASQRNMGLMLAATEGALPGSTWLYFALCQFPIYLSPLLLRRLTPSPPGRLTGLTPPPASSPRRRG